MLLPEIDYARPESVEEALRLLGSRENTRALAGGQSVVNVMKVRVASPDFVVDLGRIRELREIRTVDGGLEIGAMATYAEIIRSQEVRTVRPILAETASTIADVQVRNRGTIGGNVCSNDPTNHFPPLACALRATMTIRGPGGERTVAADEFFESVYLTAAGPGELLTKVTIPVKGENADGWAATTLGKEGTGIVNVAASVMAGSARIAIGCVAATPIMLNVSADETSIRDAVRSAQLDPPSDVHASGEYRRHLAEVLAVRAVNSTT